MAWIAGRRGRCEERGESEAMHKICEICKKAPATVHLTDIHNNVKRELHMCENCAEAKGIAMKQALSLQDLLNTMSGKKSIQASPKRRATAAEEEVRCEHCGMTWSQFRSGGRLGCAEDYRVFRSLFAPLLEEIHIRGTHHVGKRPHGPREGGDRKREIMECRRRLREAIAREAYEEAARLRDRLAALTAEDSSS